MALVASSGVDVQEGLASGEAYTSVLAANIAMSGAVPQLGAVMGVLQNNIKRMLAYSSIAHAGYLLLGRRGVVRPGGYFFRSPGSWHGPLYSHTGNVSLIRKNALGSTTYGDRLISAVVAKANVFATQFHPEKSGRWGLKLYEGFVREVSGS
mgnify:CR=1 FL=1